MVAQVCFWHGVQTVDRLCVSQVDNRHQDELLVSPEAAVKLCGRNCALGRDAVRVRLLFASGYSSVLPPLTVNDASSD